MRRIGEAIDARRQQARQRAGPEQVAEFAGRVLKAEQYVRNLSIRGGQREARARLGRKAIGQRELPGLRRKRRANRLPCRLGRKRNGNGCRGRRGLEYGLHASLGLQLKRGQAVAPKWQSAGRCEPWCFYNGLQCQTSLNRRILWRV